MTDGLSVGAQIVRGLLARRGEQAPRVHQLFPTFQPDVFWVDVPTRAALESWQVIRDATNYTGLWPVLMGSPRYLDWDREWVEREAAKDPRPANVRTAKEILADAESQSYGDWMVTRHSKVYIPPEDDMWHARWPDDERPLAHIQYSRSEEHEAIGLFPTTEGWRCPAYGQWCVANADLRPVDHCVVMRRWEQEYGAELVMRDGQAVFQFRVLRPPTDRRSAMKLAVEHYLYCTDRVDQGTGTIERLAAQLLGAPVWYFWFD